MRKGGILIVEDENIVALDMRMRLEALGYGVRAVVDSGPAALEAMTGPEPPDLVLMDIKLKGAADGIETARAARELVDLPIIFVTAFTDEKTLERAKLASPYGYIVKPFHERELRIAIELALYKFQYELSIRKAKEFAEETSRLKGEFLANVSHELKTPLNSVIGFTELALDKAADEEQRDYLSSALAGAKTLSALIDSILDFASLESGRLSAELEAFSLAGLLDGIVDVLAVGAHSKGLEATFRLDPSLPAFLVGDPGRLKQALHNLADNALKFTERGGVRLEVGRLPEGAAAGRPDEFRMGASSGAAFPKPPPGGLLLGFALEDSGIGMPAERIGEAFGRFTQLDGSRTRSAGGTGLGLAIVARSVELLGGDVAVRSAPGKGSRFELILPFGLPAGSAEPGGDGKASADGAGGRPLSGLRIGLLGFEGEARRDLEELLSSLGAAALPGQAGAEGPALDCLVADELALAGAAVKGGAGALDGARPLPLVVARRFGGSGPAKRREGPVLPLPVRARHLVSALLELGVGDRDLCHAWLDGHAEAPLGSSKAATRGPARSAARGASAAVPVAPAAPAVAAPAARGAPLAKGAAPSAARGASVAAGGTPVAAVQGELAEGAELGNLAARLEASLESLDFAAAERVSKEYRELFVARGAESCERLAFSALLLSRKGDGEGLRGVIERARRLGAAAVPRVDS
ncbi:MAG TPA: ATP-binding protein [Spirochaetales bacterium]|nr:ATP-binding protein [Spirochaetales bacterium]